MDISGDPTLPEKLAYFYFKGEGKVTRIDRLMVPIRFSAWPWNS
jgi:hypothetical protein